MRTNRPLMFAADYPYGISRTTFRRLPKAEKIELMVEWFRQNFEDPANKTPYESAEGGYQYVWGGPYSAMDEIGSMFGDLVPEKWIEEAVDEVQRDGIYDWAPTRIGDDDSDEQSNPELSLGDIPDEPGPAYGAHDDYEARKKVIAALDRVKEALDHPRPIGIGHNQPPEDIDAAAEAFKAVVQELRGEFEKPEPSIPIIKHLALRLRDGMLSAMKWGGKKLDIMLDEAAKSMGKTIGTFLPGVAALNEPHLHTALVNAYDTVVNWLHLVTLPL